jgi:SRSO17 transposase
MNTPQRQPKQERMLQAPRSPLPELAEFLAPLRVQFTQGPSAETLRQYVTGLLSEHPNKNCDTLAEVVPETSEQQLQYLLTDMVWDEQALNRQRIAQLLTVPSAGELSEVGFLCNQKHLMSSSQCVIWNSLGPRLRDEAALGETTLIE